MLQQKYKKKINKNPALKFVILLGLVSLFADITYEGARSISGPYLALLGANAITVGFVAGFGEFVGYALRLVSGYLADRTGRYWAITIIGYVCSLLAVPLLALSGHWWVAAALMIVERIGKAIRTPARDAMLSHAGQQMGMGWGFGLHEALDQIGALLGPLLMAAVLYWQGSYRESFAVLLIPALLALMILVFARYQYPQPQHLEVQQNNLEIKNIHSKAFWFYVTGASLIAAGFVDFPLMAFHFAKLNVMPQVIIPIVYAIAMGIDGFAALFLGYFYDKKGFIILIVVTLVASLFAPFVFLGNLWLAMVGIALWSVGVGAHESLMRAIVAKMAPPKMRASAYGVFNMSYGIFWFIGSVMMGALYDYSIMSLVIFSVSVQLVSIPLLLRVMKLTIVTK